MHTRVILGHIAHCLDDPARNGSDALQWINDGALVVRDGLIANVLDQQTSLPAGAEIIDYRGHLLLPGFVDTHVHYPQVDIIGAYGKQLLEWLETYTFPTESHFSNTDHATETANFFLDELLRNGTTTALVFGTVHPQSVDAFFECADARSMRMLCGKVMMDRNAPDDLCDTAETSYTDSLALIKRWHGQGRLGYAVTPRFAPTSTPEQLQAAARLLEEFPDVHMHTHLAENRAECDWVADLFPESKDYLDVYERHGLVRKRSVFAHAIHMEDSAWQRLASRDASLAHCPLSNLFIGSGLFPLMKARTAGVRVGLGTDVGGGDSFSMLRVVNEAYKVQQLQGESLAPEEAFYLATLGGARALDLDAHIGNFEVGKEADFVCVDLQATPLLARRQATLDSPRDQLFSLWMLGDDRAIKSTWIMGECSHRRQGVPAG